MGGYGKESPSWEAWRASPRGIYIDRRKRRFLIDFLQPAVGERVLLVCRHKTSAANYLRKEGCAVTLFCFRNSRSSHESGPDDQVPDLLRGDPEDLPFSDDEFDAVVLEGCLEFVADPETVVSEAVRVCRGRVFVAVANGLSLHRPPVDPSGNFSRDGRGKARFFTAGRILGLIRGILPETRVRWGSVLFFPYSWYTAWSDVEDRIPTTRNPFGYYLGFVFPVVFKWRSLQEPLASGIARDLKPETGFPASRTAERR